MTEDGSIQSSIGRAIRDRREAAGWTQERLAQGVTTELRRRFGRETDRGWTAMTVSKLERGKRHLRHYEAGLLDRALIKARHEAGDDPLARR